MLETLVVGLGGMFGAMSRWLVSEAMRPATAASGFPLGTFTVNVVGCFLLGCVACLLTDEHKLWRLFVGVGWLGGFTTFSALGWETWAMLGSERRGAALAYIGASLTCGLVAVWAGVSVGTKWGGPAA